MRGIVPLHADKDPGGELEANHMSQGPEPLGFNIKHDVAPILVPRVRFKNIGVNSPMLRVQQGECDDGTQVCQDVGDGQWKKCALVLHDDGVEGLQLELL